MFEQPELNQTDAGGHINTRIGGPLKLTREYAIILVCDLEDFSLWCQTVDASVVAEVYRRLLEATTLIVEMLGGGFVKSTGDGLIVLWTRALEVDDSPVTFVETHHRELHLSIQRASIVASVMQTATALRFGLAWPVPVAMRCAIHAGVLHRAEFPIAGTVQTDYVGEPLNAACRIEKLGKDLPGPVMSAHIRALLDIPGEEAIEAIRMRPVQHLELKSANWIASAPSCLPSAGVLQDPRCDFFMDHELGKAAVYKAMGKNAELLVFRMLEDGFSFLSRLKIADPSAVMQPWMLRVGQNLKGVYNTREVGIDLAAGEAVQRGIGIAFRRILAKFVPAEQFDSVQQQIARALDSSKDVLPPIFAGLFSQLLEAPSISETDGRA